MTDWLRAHPRVAAGIGAGALAALSFGAGRFMAPTKVETREVVRVEQVEVVKWRDRTVTERGPVHVKTVTREVPGPQGPERVVEKEVWRDRVVTVRNQAGESASASSSERVVEKVVERDAPRLTLGVTAGWDRVPTYGGWAQVRVLGPLTLMAQGEAGAGTWSARGGVGLSF